MKRRSFLAALFVAPMVPVAAKAMEAPPQIDATSFYVVDGADGLPLVFENGVLKLKSANVGQVTAGVIRSRGGKGNMVIDLGGGSMTIRS